MLQSDHSRKAAVTRGQAIPEALQPLGGVATGDMVPQKPRWFWSFGEEDLSSVSSIFMFFCLQRKRASKLIHQEKGGKTIPILIISSDAWEAASLWSGLSSYDVRSRRQKATTKQHLLWLWVIGDQDSYLSYYFHTFHESMNDKQQPWGVFFLNVFFWLLTWGWWCLKLAGPWQEQGLCKASCNDSFGQSTWHGCLHVPLPLGKVPWMGSRNFPFWTLWHFKIFQILLMGVFSIVVP